MNCICYNYEKYMLSRLLKKLNEPMTPLDMTPLRVKYNPIYQDILEVHKRLCMSNAIWK